MTNTVARLGLATCSDIEGSLQLVTSRGHEAHSFLVCVNFEYFGIQCKYQIQSHYVSSFELIQLVGVTYPDRDYN